MLRPIESAFGYFSIVPVRRAASAQAPGPAVLAALPIVGAAIGAAAGLCAWLVSFAAPQPLVTATAFGALVVLSGAIHVDGFLDCSDAVFPAVPPSRRLEILKDPRHGTYAVAGMAVVTVFWVAALGTCEPKKLPALLAFTGALARLAAVWNTRWTPYAPGGRVASALESGASLPPLLVESCVLVVASRFIAPWLWTTVPLSLVLAFALSRYIARRLGGGLVGDAYGFLIVCIEPILLASGSTLGKAGR